MLTRQMNTHLQLLVFALFAHDCMVRALPPPVSNLSLYKYSSFWSQIGSFTREYQTPTSLACVRTSLDCYPRHCDDPLTTLSFSSSARDSQGANVFTEGFLECDTGAPAPARRWVSWSHTPAKTLYTIVKLGPMDAAWPTGFYSWALVGTVLIDQMLRPTESLMLWVRDPASFPASRLAEAKKWAAAHNFSHYSSVVQDNCTHQPVSSTEHLTLNACKPLLCVNNTQAACKKLSGCDWDTKLGCFPAANSCCLAMGSETCTSPDIDRWPCCCPGYGVLPGGCSHPCSMQACGCTGTCSGPPEYGCCKPKQPCLPDAQAGTGLPLCCPSGGSGAAICEAYVCLGLETEA